MITVNLFTSGRHTQPLIKALKETKNIELVNIYSKLPYSPDFPDKTDIFVVADFGQIIPKRVLEIPKYGSLCIHPSLLPKYRGASPVQYAILNGDKETGVAIFKMDEKVDHGPIIAQFKEEIKDDDTAESLYQRLFSAGGQALVTILPAWVEGRIKPRKQNHNQATYTKILKKEDGKTDWSKSDEYIERFIRAMCPWPGAWCWVKIPNKKTLRRLKILKAHLEKTRGTRHEARGTRLVLDEVQLESKKPVGWKQFKEGHSHTKFA